MTDDFTKSSIKSIAIKTCFFTISLSILFRGELEADDPGHDESGGRDSQRRGGLAEQGDARAVIDNPQSTIGKALVAAVPRLPRTQD